MTAHSPCDPPPLVLVVDDDPTPRLLMRTALEQAGFAVEEAEDGRQALERFAQLHPPLVLLDVVMPELDGFETCAALRRQPGGKHTAVMMVTGLDDLESINRAYEVGATDFITKPINWPLLGHRVKYLLRSSRAIEELHHSKEALRESEERLTAIFETASDAIVTTDLTGLIIGVNRAGEHLSGHRREDILGWSIDSFLTPQSATQAHERTAHALRGDSVPPTFELEVQHRNGTTVPTEASARFLSDHGQPVGLVYVLRDITLEKELAQQRRAFLAMLSHDIKNPMGVILGYTEMLVNACQEQELSEHRTLLERLQSNARTVHSLVVNYLNLAKLEEGRLTVNTQPLALNPLLLQVGQQYEPAARRKHLSLKLELADELPLITGDPLGLERVFTNLLHNAMKFTPHEGHVTLRSVRHNGEVIATVSDTGPGIAPEEIPRLFEKYQRAPLGRAAGGTGLGLFIAHELVEAHGGRIEVESSPGQGASFAVYLPIAKTD